MKKILVIAVCALGATFASAQKSRTFLDTGAPEKTVTFGVRAGYNLSNQKYKYDGSTDKFDAKSGYIAGLNVDLAVLKCFGIHTGAYFESKGYKAGPLTAWMHYMQIPVLASYRANFPSGIRWDIDFGPYFAVGLGGKTKIDGIGGDFDTFGDDGYKRFDAGLAVGTGVHVDNVYFGFRYDFGLSNLNEGGLGKLRNRNFSLMVGWDF